MIGPTATTAPLAFADNRHAGDTGHGNAAPT